jgi:hypothetical protein
MYYFEAANLGKKNRTQNENFNFLKENQELGFEKRIHIFLYYFDGFLSSFNMTASRLVLQVEAM